MDKDKIVHWFTSLHTLTCTFVACAYVYTEVKGWLPVFFSITHHLAHQGKPLHLNGESADLVHLASQLFEDLLSHLLITGLRQAVTLAWFLWRSLSFHSKRFAHQASPQGLKKVFLEPRNHFLNLLGQDLRKIIKAKVS